MKKLFLKSLLTAITSIGLLLAGSAMAGPINGTLQMVGLYTPIDAVGATTTIGAATGIHFDGWFSDAATNTMFVNDATGNLAGLSGTSGSIQDFQFASFVGPIAPLWSDGNFSFDMTDLTVSTHDANNINISAIGTMHGVGYDDTPGQWIASFQGVGSTTRFSWSASQTSAPVPEPATMLLFGTGIAGLVGVARRKRS